ncbi:MAG: hypothetical protein JNL01_04290 [Bdellovibrionales bacterium]|nr:hypothetical protein [Bdellovibrionales bacterium]
MLFQRARVIAAALAVISTALVSGCAMTNPQSPVNGNGQGQGQWNPWNPGGGSFPTLPGGGGCVPISSPIGFQGQAYVDYANIVAGTLPYGYQNIGQMVVTGGGASGGMLNTRPGSSDGMISMNLQQSGFGQQMQMPYTGYPQNTYWQQTGYPSGFQQQPGFPTGGMVPGSWNPNQSMIQGTIQLSQMVMTDIMYRFGGGMMNTFPGMTAPNWYQQPGQIPGYPQQPGYGYGSQVCVSGIAMNMGRWNNLLYGGKVYLYLNGSQHGYTLQF